ncbi:GNAT family N-acetyltransferase [Photobacterium aphoticum]|uniref:GCN5 family acetyltransferase n=1 Tax=Photobacterium aphoticum TaxID=754436 RepID=A0A0J1GNY7_9GAMM|nr:GNAT family N-acetyltransferase [Photobacterium aphoticum]KLV01154.1 GCN5 family acetyltransferase [Photobacterium aphoticum]PSU55449.1 GNAT family N-acetyltransferase [Photobacterium aphoticum]GHA49256.1 acetyltransferase [Photobacterium aphoticum]
MEIVIRRSEPADAAALQALYSGKAAYSGTLQLPFPSLPQWMARVEGGDNTQFSLVAEHDGQIVGNAGLSVEQHPRRRHVANIGMAVHDDHHGKGIGSQLLAAMIDLAENWLAVTRIELSVYTDNAAGVALYEKHGFQIEGTARHYAFRDGEYVDVYHMARIKG